MNVIEYIRKYKTIVTVFGVALGIALVIIVVNADDDNDSPLALGTTTTSVATNTTAGATQPESEVPAIDCGPLLTAEETGEALAAFDRPEGQGNSFEFAQSEVCTESLAFDESYFVRIEPGNPDDFEPGAGPMGRPVRPSSTSGTRRSGSEAPKPRVGARWVCSPSARRHRSALSIFASCWAVPISTRQPSARS